MRERLTTPTDSARSPAVEAEPLAGHDVDSLALRLAERSGRSMASARRAAAKAMRFAFAPRQQSVPPAQWSDGALQAAANIGSWARPALLELSPRPVLELVERAASADQTIRLLWRCLDGELIESVIIPTNRDGPRQRTTLCLSSQVGCARRCRFCESGRWGLRRQLSPAEIVDQYRLSLRFWQRHAGGPLTNLVFMGMGEPLDNLSAVTRAVRLLCDPYGFGFTPSRITVSTVGVADEFRRFFRSTRAELAVSLNAPDDERRRRIIPVAARFDLATIRAELLAALPHGRRVLFQYALFADFNDAPADADRLADYVRPVRCRVNVLTANRGPEPSLVAPSPERVHAFVERLYRRGVRTIVRTSRGTDVGGACGQLAGAYRSRQSQAEPPEDPSATNSARASQVAR